jgi:hypothetical protein
MYTKDMILNSQWYDPNKHVHTHPCFFGTISEIIQDCCGACPPVPDDQAADPNNPYVSGKLTWVTVNPGAQTVRIGSFHPITEGDWTEEAYIKSSSESLCAAVNTDNVAAARKLLEEGADINGRDAAGRTPLMIAALSNSTQCASLLIENGARISSKLYDGRTALHLAAGYGNTKIIQMIIERGKELAAANANKQTDNSKNNKEPTKKGSKKQPKQKKPAKKSKGSDEEDEENEDEEDDDQMDEDEDEEMDEAEDEVKKLGSCLCIDCYIGWRRRRWGVYEHQGSYKPKEEARTRAA